MFNTQDGLYRYQKHTVKWGRWSFTFCLNLSSNIGFLQNHWTNSFQWGFVDPNYKLCYLGKDGTPLYSDISQCSRQMLIKFDPILNWLYRIRRPTEARSFGTFVLYKISKWRRCIYFVAIRTPTAVIKYKCRNSWRSREIWLFLWIDDSPITLLIAQVVQAYYQYRKWLRSFFNTVINNALLFQRLPLHLVAFSCRKPITVLVLDDSGCSADLRSQYC